MSLETQAQVVTAEASAPSETAVKEQTAETTATETTATTDTTEQSQVESPETTQTVPTPIDAELYDERGVPWKNVAMEQRRKYEETQQNLPKLVAEEIAKTTQQAQQKKYTIAELEQFAQANPEHRAWAEQEKATVLKAEIAQEFNQRIEATSQKARDEAVRAQTFNRVLQNFPDIAIRDQQGNFMAWNNVNPMTQTIGRYMSDPRIANDPQGLEIASKLAYADTMMAKMPQTKKRVATLKSELKKAQAATFVEGGGKRPSPENPNKKALERVRGSGKVEDGAEVMRNILKHKGMIKE